MAGRIAEHAGDRTPDRTQRLLNRAAWDTFAAMSEVRRFAVAGLEEAARRSGRRNGLVIGAIDETGQEKYGTATAEGSKRQNMARARPAAESPGRDVWQGGEIECLLLRLEVGVDVDVGGNRLSWPMRRAITALSTAGFPTGRERFTNHAEWVSVTTGRWWHLPSSLRFFVSFPHHSCI